MAKRPYRLKKRALTRDETRERILAATMELHDEKGVATTTFADVAARAHVGPATVYRNFPTIEALVQACGAHVWQEMRPPTPADATPLLEGLTSRRDRLARVIETLDAFYRRGGFRLVKAGQDRERIAGLDFFLTQVEAGVETIVRAAAGEETPEEAVRLVLALTDLKVWLSLKRFLPEADVRELMLDLVDCALARYSLKTSSG